MRRLLLPTVAATVLLAAPAQAAPTWLGPVNLIEEFEASTLGHVAVAPDGTAVAAWAKPIGASFVVQAARRRPGAGFGPVKTLTGTGDDSRIPEVGIDAQGNATVAWSQTPLPTGVSRVRAARLPAGAEDFEAVQTLSDPAAAPADGPAIGVGAGGAAVVVFAEGMPSVSQVLKASVRAGADGNFSPATTISDAFQFFNDKAVTVNAGGAAVAIYSGWDGMRGRVESNDRPAGGAFAPAGDPRSSTAPGVNAFNATVVLDAGGRATALWTHSIGGTDEVMYADRPAGGLWSPGVRASQLPGATESASNPSAAVTSDGTVIAAWSVGDAGGGLVVEGAVRPPGGAFGDYRKLSAPGMDVFATRTVVNGRGDAMIVWPGSSQEAVYAVRRPAGGSFGGVDKAVRKEDHAPGEELSFFGPDVGLDDEGNATGLWSRLAKRGMTDFYGLQAGGFDAAPPTLAAVSVPISGTAGAGVGMAAAATDRWTHVSYHWSFGDGAAAAGGAVMHAFGAPGAFNVTVTATDAVGNATSATRPVLVSAGPPSPRIDSAVTTRWAFNKRRVFLLRMTVNAPPKGARAELRCAGKKKCPFKRRTVTRIRRNALTVFNSMRATKAVKKKSRRFRPGQTLQLRITAAGYMGKVVTYRIRKGRIPAGKIRCLPEGAKQAQSC